MTQPFHAPADTQRGGVIDIGYKPHPWQVKASQVIGQAGIRAFVLVVARQQGKTEWALRTLQAAALFTHGHYAYIAPMRQTAKAVAWSRLKALVARIPQVEIKEADLVVRFPCPGNPSEYSSIGLYGASDDETGSSVRGLSITGAVLDEVAQMPWDFIQSAFLPTQTAIEKPWFIAIGTARGQADSLYELYRQAASTPNWASMKVPVTESGALSPARIAEIKAMTSENAWLREYLCSFEVGTEDQLIRTEHALAAAQRTVGELERRDLAQNYPLVMGVDIGLQRDRSVLALRQGSAVLDIITLDKPTVQELAFRIMSIVREREVDGLFVDAGSAGHAVCDVLRALGLRPVEVQFGERPNAGDIYLNKRAEMYDLMRAWIERSDASIPNGHELHREITATRFKLTPANKLALEPKDEVKKRIGVSPDQADAIALTFAANLPNPRLAEALEHDIAHATSRRGAEDALMEIGPDGSKYTSHRRTRLRRGAIERETTFDMDDRHNDDAFDPWDRDSGPIYGREDARNTDWR